jgi:annexin A7/11
LQDLFEAGEGTLGTREEVFNAIFNQRSSKHMREVFDAYKDLADGNEMESAIESEFSGSLKTAYLAMGNFPRF